MQKSRRRGEDRYKVLYGTCPDDQCHAKLYFPAYDNSIECTNCGQRHDRAVIQNVAEVTNPSIALHNILKNILLGNVKPKRGADNVKVLGLSNYACKLISPILTYYGFNRNTGKAQQLTEMGQGEMFDCGKSLADRAFLIEEENLSVVGYGRDRTGSAYLADTIEVLKDINDGEERLIPIHADGDGHCLVHAISRALVGRELFWHSLRMNLLTHFSANLERYKEHFKEFIDIDEWESIINESHPDFLPADGEPLGLRNIHVFGLANILRRPIILLDSISGMKSLGDYSGVFLPVMVPPEKCRGKDGEPHRPLCIAWSSLGRNHYIPLVAVKGRAQPRLPRYMLQKTWGAPPTLIDKYIAFDARGMCTIGGDKCLTDKYIRQLVSVMEEVFEQQYHVQSSLVADVHQYIYKTSGIVGVNLDDVIEATQKSVKDGRLYRCLTCEALTEYRLPPEWFRKNGSLYNLAVQSYGELKVNKRYSFPDQGVICSYDKEADILVPDMANSHLSRCTFCHGDNVRLVNGDGGIKFQNGDRTTTLSKSSRCGCGYKHYWDGKEYDNLPEMFPISLDWNGKVVGDKVAWFQYEEETANNSNVFQVAQGLVQKHFPGEFGSERLVQRVVDTILRLTASKENAEKPEPEKNPVEPAWSPESSSKIILTGHAHTTLHKEELTRSEKERQVRKSITANAPKSQQKKSSDATTTGKSSPKQANSPVRENKKPPLATSSPPPHSATHPNEKRIKVVTSDGRQPLNLTLTSEVTFDDLRKMLADALNVPPEKQKIRLGFPPRELKPPAAPDTREYIKLQHGDKLSLEILPEQTELPEKVTEKVKEQTETVTVTEHPPSSNQKSSWGSFEEETHNHTAEALLASLKEAHSGGDSLDTSISSLSIMSTLMGKDLWTYVQTMPHLFSVGGLFYQQVKRDLGLVDGKHCQLPALPGKVFRYSSKENRLEICLEPHGHFQIEPNVERRAVERVNEMDAHGEVRFGFSGAAGHHDSRQVAFSGHGHSLRSIPEIERMPEELPEGHPKHHARRLQNLCDPNHHEDSIAEEPEDVDEGGRDAGPPGALYKDAGPPGALYKRVGPGYSVIDPTTTNTTNNNLEMFRMLADSIKKSFSEESLDSEPQIPTEEEMITNDFEEAEGGAGAELSNMDVCVSDEHQVPCTSSASGSVSAALDDGSVESSSNNVGSVASSPNVVGSVASSPNVVRSVNIKKGTKQTTDKIPLDSSRVADETQDSIEFFVEVSTDNPDKKILLESFASSDGSSQCIESLDDVEPNTNQAEKPIQGTEKMDTDGQEIVRDSNNTTNSQNQVTNEIKVKLGETPLTTPPGGHTDGRRSLDKNQ